MQRQLTPDSVTEAHFFDFDSTLMNSPDPDPGKAVYEEQLGVPYPHLGWWGREESLHECLDVQPHQEVVERLLKCDGEHQCRVLLTNRQYKLRHVVKALLDKHGMVLDEFAFKRDEADKPERLLQLLARYPNVKRVFCYDDDTEVALPRLTALNEQLAARGIEINVFRVLDGRVTPYDDAASRATIPSYCGVVLTEVSRRFLIRELESSVEIPSGWEVIAHHMTTKMGPLPEHLKERLGERVGLEVIGYGFLPDKALAVRLAPDGFPSRSEVPHVTVAVNRASGGKPYDSNKITEWMVLNAPISLVGIVAEVYQ